MKWMKVVMTTTIVMNSSLLALLDLIGDDSDIAINLVTEAADRSDILDLVIDGIFDDTD